MSVIYKKSREPCTAEWTAGQRSVKILPKRNKKIISVHIKLQEFHVIPMATLSLG